MQNQYTKDPFNALEALNEAQKLAFSPVAFQAAWALIKLNILNELDGASKSGLTIDEISDRTNVTTYGIGVLLDMGLSIGLVYRKDKSYIIGRMGKMLIYDEMTRVNMAFTQDVCYQAMFHLSESIEQGKPEGLKVLGDWPTIYPGLPYLPEKAKTAWHEFDHYYSDKAFPVALPLIFRENPNLLFDIGGNTGKWSLECVRYNEQIEIKILDLPQQITRAVKNIEAAGFSDRISGLAIDLLDSDAEIPSGADIYWMSQFLDCFSEQQIISILKLIRAAMKPEAKIYILELLWDQQQYDAASYSLNAISLYFTAIANGDSRFYEKSTFIDLVEQSGLTVEEQINDIGPGHTLLVCVSKQSNHLIPVS